MIDVVRSCGVYEVKAWRNRDDTVPVRFYRVPLGTPALPYASHFLSPDWDESNASGRDKYGLRRESRTVQPGEPGLPVGLHSERVRYDRGIPPVGWRPPTHFLGTEEQWTQGSEFPRHQPLVWRGGWSTACRALEPQGRACLSECEQCPKMSPIWIVGGFTAFAGLDQAALVWKRRCEFDSKCVPGGTCPTGTSAAWQVVLDEPFGGLTGGVMPFRDTFVWSTCCSEG